MSETDLSQSHIVSPADERMTYTLDLSPLRARLGQHWSLYSDVVFRIAEIIINKSIGAGDNYSRDGLTIKIELDASAGRNVGAIFCEIENKLSQTLLPDGQAVASPLDKDDGKQHLVAGLDREASHVGSDSKISGSFRSNPALLSRVAGHRGAGRSTILPTTGSRLLSQETSISDVDGAAARFPEAASMNGMAHGRVYVTYRPIWKIDSHLIAIYRATPTLVVDNRIRLGDAVLTNPRSRDLIARLDELTLWRVLFDLEAHARNSLDVVVVVPIHLSSFTDQWWSTNLLRLCRKIPESARRHVVFEAVDAVHVGGDSRIKAVMRMLKPFCRRFGAIMPLQARDLGFLSALGFDLIAVEASAQPGTEMEIIDLLDQFYMIASQEGLLTGAWGLRTHSLVLAAAAIGYDLINGQMIGGFPTGVLLSQIDYHFEDLYEEQACVTT